MNAKNTLFTFAATPIIVFLLMFAIYLGNPLAFHFRAWEFFDIFVYNGFYGRQHHLIETGDSSRNYLFQRYSAANTVSVNEFGNRIACYDVNRTEKPRVLLVGDSQLFASGTDDGATFSAQLCRLYEANVYDGSRRNGLSLLRVESFRFDAILFTTTERHPLAAQYCPTLDQLAAEYDQKIPDRDIRLPRATLAGLYEVLTKGEKFFVGYMKSRLQALFTSILLGPVAPTRHIIIASHRYQPVEPVVANDIACAQKLSAFFEAKGLAVGFLYFPSHQTLYGKEADFAVDEDTASYIDRMSAKLAAAGLRTMNTKECLNKVKSRTLVYQIHDTHLNADGYRSLAECVGRSDLSALVAPDTIIER